MDEDIGLDNHVEIPLGSIDKEDPPLESDFYLARSLTMDLSDENESDEIDDMDVVGLIDME